MHPIIRILCLVIAAGFLARGGWRELALVAVGLGGLYLRLGMRQAAQLLRVLRRLKFLWLSILIAYLWFTPGERLWPEAGGFSPTRAGLAEGGLRVAALLLLVAAVHLLLERSSREDLVAALRWFLLPLRPLLAPDRVALRLVLAMEAVPRLRAQVAAERPRGAQGPVATRIGGFAAGVFGRTLAAAEEAELPVVNLPELAPPPLLQWSAPVVLAAALWWV